MRAVFDLVRTIADSNGTALIIGESGTGKEIVANVIHCQSRRRFRPFVAVSCAIFSDTLIAELSCSATNAAPSQARSRTGRAGSSRRRAEQCFSMTSTMCRSRCR
ncbi:MAG: sigma 54-interacting transcriptional regulator [Thermoanaerobaculia bacterium]